jgi:hypothetical protein
MPGFAYPKQSRRPTGCDSGTVLSYATTRAENWKCLYQVHNILSVNFRMDVPFFEGAPAPLGVAAETIPPKHFSVVLTEQARRTSLHFPIVCSSSRFQGWTTHQTVMYCDSFVVKGRKC